MQFGFLEAGVAPQEFGKILLLAGMPLATLNRQKENGTEKVGDSMNSAGTKRKPGAK
jgi:hypothetical protein